MKITQNQENLSKDDMKLVGSFSSIMNHFGKFQIRSLLILCSSGLLCGLTVLSFVFLNITPPFQCQQSSSNFACSPENRTSFSDLCNNSKHEQCSRYKIDMSMKNLDPLNTSSLNTTKEQCLDGWIFNISLGNTVVSQFDLICENSWKKPLTVSLFMVGMFFGSLFGSPIADKYGRRWASLIAIAAHSLFHIALSLSPSFWFYASFVVLLGAVHIDIYLTCYTWVQELLYSNDKRVASAFFLNLSFAIGGLSASPLAYYQPNWEWILRIIAFFASACFLSIWWFVPESPSWCLQRKKVKEAVVVLKKIVRINNIEANINEVHQQEQNFNDVETDKTKSEEVVSPVMLLKNKIFLQRILLICYLWNNCFLGYYTMILNASNLGGSVYINNVIGAALDIGAAFVMTVMLKKLSRRNTLCIMNVVFGLFSVFSPPMKQVNLIAGITFSMCGRFFATASMWLIIFYTGELFPTKLRNTSLGIASMSSRIASILSPFLVFAGEEIDLSIPFYVIGGMSFLGAFFTFFLPDTSHSLLPETVEDALKLTNNTLSCKKKKQTIEITL